MARTWFSSAVGANLRKGMPFAAAVRSARGMRLPARRNPASVAANPENPWVKGYQFWSPRGRKVVKVGSYWKPKGTKSKGRKPRARRKLSRKSQLRYFAHLGGMKSAIARRGLRVKRMAANPKRHKKSRRRPSRKFARRNAPFTYQVGPVSANPPFTYSVGPVSANPRRKSRRKSWMKRNPYAAASPFMAGFEGVDVFSNPGAGVASLKDFALGFTKMDWITKELLPLGGGLAATKIATGYLLPKLFTKAGVVDAARKETCLKYKPLIEAGVAIALGGIVGLGLKKTDIAVRITTGGLIGALVSAIEKWDWYQTKTASLKGLGAVSTTMKTELAKAVQREIKKAEAGMSGVGQQDWEEEEEGIEAFATERDISGEPMGAFVTDDDMNGMNEGVQGMTVEGFLAEPSMA